ncbi:MAG TPA: SpoIIE family protein phosphatase [Anaerolineales bacterium]|nr:SpoIIE family protein phosphatase [Anaerolineales bacterium]
MSKEIIARIEKSLVDKRQNLYHWLESTPAEEKEICLCEDEACVQPHLQVIEDSMDKASQGTLGICEVCHGQVEDSRLEVDYTACVCLGDLSEEERRRLEAELELSQIIQRALLPQQMPSIPGLELAAFSRPAEIVGGDYFDFPRFADGAYGIAIADVVGHGVSASILMSSLQTALATLVPQSNTTDSVLERINHFYIHNVNLTTFITAFLAHYEPGTRIITYSNAGQTPPLVFRKETQQEFWLKPTSAAIGLVEEYQARSASMSLTQGDTFLLYTDGVTEATNLQGEQFGAQRLAELFRENADCSAQDLVLAVRKAVGDFSAGRPLKDDVTIVVGKVG